jgi:hypothetical protein
MFLAVLVALGVVGGLSVAAVSVSSMDSRSTANGQYRTVDLDQVCLAAQPTEPPPLLAAVHQAAPNVNETVSVTVKDGKIVPPSSDFFNNGNFAVVQVDGTTFEVRFKYPQGQDFCLLVVKDVPDGTYPKHTEQPTKEGWHITRVTGKLSGGTYRISWNRTE